MFDKNIADQNLWKFACNVSKRIIEVQYWEKAIITIQPNIIQVIIREYIIIIAL